jgi:hypothetical protein
MPKAPDDMSTAAVEKQAIASEASKAKAKAKAAKPVPPPKIKVAKGR